MILLVGDSNRGGFLNMSVGQRKIRAEKLSYVFLILLLNFYINFAELKELEEPKASMKLTLNQLLHMIILRLNPI